MAAHEISPGPQELHRMLDAYPGETDINPQHLLLCLEVMRAHIHTLLESKFLSFPEEILESLLEDQQEFHQLPGSVQKALRAFSHQVHQAYLELPDKGLHLIDNTTLALQQEMEHIPSRNTPSDRV